MNVELLLNFSQTKKVQTENVSFFSSILLANQPSAQKQISNDW